LVDLKCVVYLYYNNKTKNNIMTTIKNTLSKLDLQVKVLIISSIVLMTLFTTMIIKNGFTQF
jgi:hypothetical protein